jgi:nucleotidyltransferase/DNA polymerase involved in DNA repair
MPSTPSGASRVRTPLPGLPPPLAPPVRWIAYVDLDAFYVSCELHDRPELRGQPVIVGPPPAAGPSRGVVLSASYEARKFGVRSALPAAVAYRLCPQAVWIAPDFSRYERVSREVRTQLAHFSSEVIPYSIDEAAVVLDVSDPIAARGVAERIQRELKDSLDLPSSVGVATSRVIAKIATDQAKPGGIRVVPPGEVTEFLAPLPVRSIPGVGPKTEQVLQLHDVRTIGELAARRPAEVASWFGGYGRELVALARGQPHESPETGSGPRSRSTDHTFARDVTTWEELETALRELALDLAHSLEREGLRYGGVGVAFRWDDFERSQHSRALTASREGSGPLEESAIRLGRELWDAERAGPARAVRTVSVRAERLSERTQRQVSLDDFPGSRAKAPK